MKIYDKKLAYPYFVWMTLFTVVPLIIVVYYALTDADGNPQAADIVSTPVKDLLKEAGYD